MGDFLEGMSPPPDSSTAGGMRPPVPPLSTPMLPKHFQGCGVVVAISDSDSDSGSDAKYDAIINTVQSLITVFS